jgi:heme/copper-type cytochrome/quinol oxidase subunit 2
MTGIRRHGLMASACVVLLAVLWIRAGAREQGQLRDIAIQGSDFAFSPARLEVQRDDLVKIAFTAKDIAHSFTMDDYRISKRAGPGQTVVFEFRADRPGTFRFYCNITQDERCRQMHGELVVR